MPERAFAAGNGALEWASDAVLYKSSLALAALLPASAELGGCPTSKLKLYISFCRSSSASTTDAISSNNQILQVTQIVVTAEASSTDGNCLRNVNFEHTYGNSMDYFGYNITIYDVVSILGIKI
jgi:hypothetical protein